MKRQQRNGVHPAQPTLTIGTIGESDRLARLCRNSLANELAELSSRTFWNFAREFLVVQAAWGGYGERR